MNTITEKDKDFEWRKGFEAGVAFTLRHSIETGMSSHEFTKFVSRLSTLRTWKTYEEWRDLVERNLFAEGRDA